MPHTAVREHIPPRQLRASQHNQEDCLDPKTGQSDGLQPNPSLDNPPANTALLAQQVTGYTKTQDFPHCARARRLFGKPVTTRHSSQARPTNSLVEPKHAARLSVNPSLVTRPGTNTTECKLAGATPTLRGAPA